MYMGDCSMNLFRLMSFACEFEVNIGVSDFCQMLMYIGNVLDNY